MRGLFFVCALIGNNFVLSAIDLSSANFRYKYDIDAPLSFQSKFTQFGDSLQLIFDLKFREAHDSLPNVNLYIQANYNDGSEKANTPALVKSPLQFRPGIYRYVYKFIPDSSDNLVVVGVTHTDLRVYYYDIPFSESFNFEPPNFGLLTLDSIEMTSYSIVENERFLSSDSNAVIFRYKEEFPVASPPMVKSQKVAKNISVDSVFHFKNQLSPIRNQLYFVQNDTNSLRGIAMLGVPQLYPKLISITDLVKPLVYISTKVEFEGFNSAPKLKAALDAFWVEVTGLRSRAVDTIKKFYRRVAESNQFFTTYKQGWKTDQGMIYIIFGVPTRVSKTINGENWTFENRDGKSVEFAFNKIKNLFTPNHYELNRSEDYGDVWYRQVDLWRKGRI